LFDKEREQRMRTEKIDLELRKFAELKREQIKRRQEELFLIDLERERDNQNKSGQLAIIKKRE